MKTETSKVESALKNLILDKDVRPSSVAEANLDRSGLQLRISVPRGKLTNDTMRNVLSLLLSDAM